MFAGALQKFKFGTIEIWPNQSGATVHLNFASASNVNGEDVGHHVTVKVRVALDANQSLLELQETAYQKALEQLHSALSMAEGKTARILLAEAHAEALAEQEESARSWRTSLEEQGDPDS